MRPDTFIIALLILLPALLIVFGILIALGVDELNQGHRATGLAIIALVPVIALASIPWFLL